MLRVGLVQHAWRSDAHALHKHLLEAIGQAAYAGAEVVCLPEIALLRYPADARPAGRACDIAEDLTSGPTFELAATAAQRHGVVVHASLYQRSAEMGDGLGWSTAILVDASGALIGGTHKLHIPITAGYYEDSYFRPEPGAGEASGPAHTTGTHRCPVHPTGHDPYQGFRPLSDLACGLPTCWDEWFPEVARCYALAGANVLIYPTAIGSDPDFPNFDTSPSGVR